MNITRYEALGQWKVNKAIQLKQRLLIRTLYYTINVLRELWSRCSVSYLLGSSLSFDWHSDFECAPLMVTLRGLFVEQTAEILEPAAHWVGLTGHQVFQ
jgi:hypothetical protein